MAITEAGEHPFAYLRKRADVLKCCGQEKNLHVTQPRPDTLLAHCLVCGRKHRLMRAEPGTIFAKGVEAMAQKREATRGLILPGDPAYKV